MNLGDILRIVLVEIDNFFLFNKFFIFLIHFLLYKEVFHRIHVYHFLMH